MKAADWLGLVAAAATLQGCAAGTTFSQLSGERFFVTNLDTHSVLISSVDGRSSVTHPVLVEPGERHIVLQGPPGGSGYWALKRFTLDVKPCTRYFIVAVRTNPLNANFTPRVDYQEPLAGCKPPAG